ncbi:leucine-rich repeat domain-containing protein [Candidatus Lokiarchaeum ossiferum]|uniref:leucine-rich repeat domain-containing protein n=1 Tax=Candidatus Lokiarchaeum ossiferum TaxID=2951803 RepID=UPI00352DA006
MVSYQKFNLPTSEIYALTQLNKQVSAGHAIVPYNDREEINGLYFQEELGSYVFCQNNHAVEIGLIYWPKSEQIRKEILNFSELEAIFIDGKFPNNLFPIEMSKLTKIKKICIQNSDIERIPEFIFSLSQIEELELSWCNLKYISSKIGKLESLKKLNLSGNKIQEIPTSIRHLKNVEMINFSSNQLKTLPDEMVHLQNINHLYLFKNNLEELFDGIGMLKNLHSLEISQNFIKSLPKSLEKLHNLKKFGCLGNKGGLNIFDELDLSNWTSLEGISIENVSNQQVTQILHNNELRDITLKHIEILEVIPNHIKNLQNLESIAISGANIRKIPATLINIGRMKKISLYNCPKLNAIEMNIEKKGDRLTIYLKECPKFTITKDIEEDLLKKNIEIRFRK